MNEEKDTQIVIESDPFSMIPNDFIRNPQISNDAKALYAIIKSYIGIPDFILYKSTLLKSFKGGDTKFRNAWKDLKDKGYLIQIRSNTSRGFIYKYKLISKPVCSLPEVDQPRVDESRVADPHTGDPQVAGPGVDSPHVENPRVGNQHSYKELSNNNDSNNNDLNKLVVEKINKGSDAVVEGHGNQSDKPIAKGFDENRFLNSKDVTIQVLRISEALYFGEEAKESISKAVKYLADSCNCFGLESIKVINTFTDSEYGELFNIAYDLANGQSRFNDIDNPKRFMSSEIKKRIANHMTS